MAQRWLSKYSGFSLGSRVGDFDARLQRGTVITFEFLLALCHVQMQMQNSVTGE